MIGDWNATRTAVDVAPLHVHHAYAPGLARHVVSGVLRFRFTDRQVIAPAGTSVPAPAGTAHTFGNAGPGRHDSSSSSRPGWTS